MVDIQIIKFQCSKPQKFQIMNINWIKKKTNEQNKNPKTKQNNDRLNPLYTEEFWHFF